MNGQVQFGGLVPFTDRSSGQQVQVRVWGVYVGQGVDAHEESAIQQWIMNALASSAASYEGNVHELPAKAQEWGGWVSQQIAPGLAQAFQAHGQIHIQGVQIEGAGGMKGAAPMKGAPMASGPMGAAPMGAAPMSAGGGKADVAAQALMKNLGMPQDQAYRAAQIVIEVLGGGGAAMAGGHDPYAQKGHDPYAKKPADPYAQKAADPYAQKAHDPYAQKGHDPYAKKPADPYAQKAADPYAQKGAPQPDPYAKKAADPYAQKGAPQPDPYAQKGDDPYKKKY